MGPRLSKSEVVDLATLTSLVDSRIKEARLLAQSKFFATAAYLAGYAVECQLKAVICKTLGLDSLPATFKTHDLELLLFHSGMYRKIREKKEVHESFGKVCGLWNEKMVLRYQCRGEFPERDLNLFFEWIEDPDRGVIPWLRKAS